MTHADEGRLYSELDFNSGADINQLVTLSVLESIIAAQKVPVSRAS